MAKAPANKKQDTHVDLFIDFGLSHSEDEKYARFVLMLKRLNATLRLELAEYINKYALYCTYEGKRYRVNMASRLGHIGLTPYFDRTSGYEQSVFVDNCTNWGPNP